MSIIKEHRQAERGKEWNLCCLTVTLIHMLLDFHSDPKQQQHQVVGKLPLLTSPASSSPALHHNMCSSNIKLYAVSLNMICCFIFLYMLFSYVWNTLLHLLSGKFLLIFQNQLKHHFLHETFPDV